MCFLLYALSLTLGQFPCFLFANYAVPFERGLSIFLSPNSKKVKTTSHRLPSFQKSQSSQQGYSYRGCRDASGELGLRGSKVLQMAYGRWRPCYRFCIGFKEPKVLFDIHYILAITVYSIPELAPIGFLCIKKQPDEIKKKKIYKFN